MNRVTFKPRDTTGAHTQASESESVSRGAQPQPPQKKVPQKTSKPLIARMGLALAFSAWVIAAFIGAQLLLVAVLYGVNQLDSAALSGINETVLQTVISALVYALSLGIAAGIPWVALKSQRLTWTDLGFSEALPSWRDIGLAPVVFVVSLVASTLALFIATQVLPGLDLQTEQQIGFDNVTQRYELLMAFLTLVVLAPIFEEVLFRGYLYDRIRRYVSVVWTVIITSLVFGLMHLYAGPDYPLQWNVMINTTVLALCIGALRAYTGNVWAGILVHMLKNGVAFFVLFVMPMLGISLV